MKLLIDNHLVEYSAHWISGDELKVIIDEKEFVFCKEALYGDQLVLSQDGERFFIRIAKDEDQSHLIFKGKDHFIEESKNIKRVREEENHCRAPMPGKVFKVLVTTEQEVKKGETLVILEAMKMEHSVKAPHDGIVEKILFKEGEQVEMGQDLVAMLSLKRPEE